MPPGHAPSASIGVPDTRGALVAEVLPQSPAARAGLRAGDVIRDLNGKRIDNPGELARAVGLARPGDAARLTVWRDRAERTVQVTLAQAPGERAASRLGLEGRPESDRG